MEIEAWLDCADDAGYALAALDEGCKALCLSGSQEVLKKLQEIAALRGARILHRSELDSGSSGR